MNYEFALIVPDLDDHTADSIYGLCPDSSIGKSNGTTFVAFDRQAETFGVALASAVAGLRKLGIKPARVEMDIPDSIAV